MSRLKYMLIDPHYPDVGIEFNSDAIRLAEIAAEKGKIQIRHLDEERLPPDTIEITPFKPNIISLERAAEALRKLWARYRTRASKICVLLQDRSALTFNVSLENPATRPEETLDLIRFKLKKSVPFRMDEAKITYFNDHGIPDHTNRNLWTVLINNQVLHQYEEFIKSAIDSECGLVDLSTFNIMNLAHAQIAKAKMEDQDILFVNLNRDYISLAIIQKGKLTFYRSRDLEGQNGFLDEAIAEIHPATLFYVDKLEGKSLSRVFVYSFENSEEACSRLERDLQLPCSILSVGDLSGVQIDPSRRMQLQTFAPLVGLLVSRRVEFA